MMVELTVPIIVGIAIGGTLIWICLAVGFSVRNQNKEKQRLSKRTF